MIYLKVIARLLGKGFEKVWKFVANSYFLSFLIILGVNIWAISYISNHHPAEYGYENLPLIVGIICASVPVYGLTVCMVDFLFGCFKSLWTEATIIHQQELVKAGKASTFKVQTNGIGDMAIAPEDEPALGKRPTKMALTPSNARQQNKVKEALQTIEITSEIDNGYYLSLGERKYNDMSAI